MITNCGNDATFGRYFTLGAADDLIHPRTGVDEVICPTTGVDEVICPRTGAVKNCCCCPLCGGGWEWGPASSSRMTARRRHHVFIIIFADFKHLNHRLGGRREDTHGFGHQNEDGKRSSHHSQDVITPLSLSTANSFSCYINVPVSYIFDL